MTVTRGWCCPPPTHTHTCCSRFCFRGARGMRGLPGGWGGSKTGSCWGLSWEPLYSHTVEGGSYRSPPNPDSMKGALIGPPPNKSGPDEGGSIGLLPKNSAPSPSRPGGVPVSLCFPPRASPLWDLGGWSGSFAPPRLRTAALIAPLLSGEGGGGHVALQHVIGRAWPGVPALLPAATNGSGAREHVLGRRGLMFPPSNGRGAGGRGGPMGREGAWLAEGRGGA